jgi:PAS domain S-box-containing protein
MMSRRVERVVLDDFAGEGFLMTRSAARRVGALFRGIGSQLQELSGLSEVRDASPGVRSEAMEAAFESMREYISCLRRIDRRGDLVVGYRAEDGTPIETAPNEFESPWFQAVAAGSERMDGPVVSRIFLDDAGERRVRVTLPLWVENGEGVPEFDGVLTCGVRIDRIFGMMVEPFQELEPWERFALFKRDGEIIALPGHSDVEGRNFLQDPAVCGDCHAFSAPLFDIVRRGAGLGTVDDPRGDPLVTIGSPVHLGGQVWVVCLYADYDAVMHGAREISRYSVLLAFASILFVLVGATIALLLVETRRVARRQKRVIDRERGLLRRARESEARYRDLFEGVDNAVYISSPDGRFLEVNGAMARMLGYDSREELLAVGNGDRLYADPVDRERERAEIEAAGVACSRESRLLRKDGEPIVCLETSLARRDEAGNVVEHMGVLVDITRRKRSERLIRERNDELRALHEISKVINRSLSIDEVLERSLEKILEATAFEAGAIHLFDESTNALTVQAFTGESREILADPDVIRPGEGLAGAIARDREPVFLASLAEDSWCGAPGPECAYHAYAGLPLLCGERLTGVLQIASVRRMARGEFRVQFLLGISELIAVAIRNARLFEQIRKANEDLNRVSAMKSQFVSLVSHELRTPMTAIRGSLDIIHSGAAGPVPEKHRMFISMARRNIVRLSDMINNILDLSRIESGRIDYDFGKVDLQEPLCQVMMTLAGTADEKRITLESRVPADLPALYADEAKVEQILTNLIGNAIKCTPEGGCITVSAEPASATDLERLGDPPPDGAFVRVSVVDSGSGVPADQLEAVFDSFHQLKGKKGERGSGLGLAICRYFIDGHGGAIWAEREIGQGGIFRFLLPVWAPGRTA